MRRCFQLFLSLHLLLSATVDAQPQTGRPADVRLFERYSVTVPPAWRAGKPMRNAETLYVPLLKPRHEARPRLRKNPKPDEAPITSEAGMLITIEPRRSHADALARVANIASEQPAEITPIVIGGWPAIERRYRAPMPEPGDATGGDRITWFASTAVAAADVVLRFETMLAPDADPKWVDEALAIGRSLKAPGGDAETAARELTEIRRLAHPPAGAPGGPPLPGTKEPRGEHPTPGVTRAQNGFGELEVIASADGQHVALAANSGWSFSDDSGGSFTFGGGTPCIYNGCDGDPSLALGQSGNMYYSWIGFPTMDPSGHPDGVTDSLSVSTTNGHSWAFVSDAVFCPTAGMGVPCSIPDQEHIASDRFQASATANDRIYLVWRNFGTPFSIDIVCSSNSGAAWSAPTVIDAGSDFPRVAVGPDSSVYVAYRAGGNMNLRRFTACDSGFTPDPVTTVSAFTMVTCPMPGLDRCNSGNILSSPMVAADGNDVFYAFATNTAAGNDNVMVFDSTDHGATFPRSVRANTAVTGRRFMPWITANNGMALLTWYDRRNGTTPATIDQTRVFGARAWVKSGTLVASEYDVSQIDDAQCSSGWPCGTRSAADATGCPTPQVAGLCYVAATGMGSFTPCSFTAPVCPAGETCNTASGCPKYGDYNGNGAIAGRRFSAWASATPPPGVVGAPAGINVYADGANIPSDYYVRDWTDTALVFDDGAEPSIRPDFWARSDVWNQSTAVAAAPVSGWILGDAPIRGGSNFAFARVSRRHPASTLTPAESVRVHLMWADYGASLPLVDIGTTTANFAAGNLTSITPALSWSVPMTASIHLCLAVEITGPGGTDDFIPPTLVGAFVGPSDPLIVADNNKAQRNLQETVSSGTSMEMIAQAGVSVHERSPFPLRLKIRQPISPELDGVIEELGGGRATASLKDGTLDLGLVQPGEVRFVRIRLTNVSANLGQIDVYTMAGDRPYNGFSMRAHRDHFFVAAPVTLREWGSVLDRLAFVAQQPRAKTEAEAARKLAESMKDDAGARKAYAAYLRSSMTKFATLVVHYVPKKDDVTEVNAAFAHLQKASKGKDWDDALAAQKELVERLDARLTMNMRAKK